MCHVFNKHAVADFNILTRGPRKIGTNRGFLATRAPTGKFHFASPAAPRYLVG